MSVLADDLRSRDAKGGREQRNCNLSNLERETPPNCLYKPSFIDETVRLLSKGTNSQTCSGFADEKVLEQKTTGDFELTRIPRLRAGLVDSPAFCRAVKPWGTGFRSP